MVTINAAGDALAPYLLLPLKYLPRDIATFVVRGRINVGGSSNGYMQDQNFEEWSNWFIQMVIQLRKDRGYPTNQRALLFLDGHVTRNNKKVMKRFQRAYIIVIIFPPHLTHLMQPFDTTVARPLKKALKSFASALLERMKTDEQNFSGFLRLAQVVAIIDSITVSTTITNCANAFRCCGLYPRNIDEVLAKEGIKRSSQSFISFEKTEIKPLKISGLCITQEDVIDNLRDVEEQRKAKEEKKAKKEKVTKKI